MIRADFSPVAIAEDYATHGASAISVLTEERFFQGSLQHLEEIHAAVKVPLLRKDFTIDPYQIERSEELRRRRDFAHCRNARYASDERSARAGERSGIGCYYRSPTEKELAVAVEVGAQVIGVNNRDLKTFAVRHLDHRTVGADDSTRYAGGMRKRHR